MPCHVVQHSGSKGDAREGEAPSTLDTCWPAHLEEMQALRDRVLQLQVSSALGSPGLQPAYGTTAMARHLHTSLQTAHHMFAAAGRRQLLLPHASVYRLGAGITG